MNPQHPTSLLPPQSFNGLYTPLTATGIASAITDGKRSAQAIANEMLTTVPSQTVDVRQAETGLTDDGNIATASFSCGDISGLRYQPVQSVIVNNSHEATLAFCPSRDSVSISYPDETNSGFKAAFGRFVSDPLRNVSTGAGDGFNLLLACPDLIRSEDPALGNRLRYDQQSGSISVRFVSQGIDHNCDLIGQYGDKYEAQVKLPGHKRYQRVGRRVAHLNGEKEVISYQYLRGDYTGHIVIPDVGQLCNAGGSRAKVRLKIRVRLVASRRQQYYRLFRPGESMPSPSRAGFTSPEDVC